MTAPLPPWASRALGVVLLVLSCAAIGATVLLAGVHVDDRFDVGAASGAWMGLAAAAHAGVWYPAPFAHGFYGGTRYMPLPILLELAGRAVSGEYLVSAKVIVYAANLALFVLLYVVLRRRGAPLPLAVALVAAVVTSSAAQTSALAVRWDALATLLQLLALFVVADTVSRGRALSAGGLCALALLVKISALWAPAAIVVWLFRRTRRLALEFVLVLAAGAVVLAGSFDLASHGRLHRQISDFAFAGSTHSSLRVGLNRLYQLALRNERSLPLLLVLAGAVLAVALVRRRVGIYELALLFAIPIVIVVMRDYGAYENHLLDLEVLAAAVLAGLSQGRYARRLTLGQGLVGLCVLAAGVAAARYTLVPVTRSALSHELRGKVDPRYGVHPLPRIAAQGTCALFEDATVPVLAGQRPVVLDAFIVHRLQTVDPPAITALVRRVEQRRFRSIVLDVPLTDQGWFATLDFGTALANAMRANYRLVSSDRAQSYYVYAPARPASARACSVATWG